MIFTTKHVFPSRISLSPEEGGGSAELVSGGRDIQVNETNLYDYVRLYANYRLIKTQEKALEVCAFDFEFCIKTFFPKKCPL